jgi:hypothetical protein
MELLKCSRCKELKTPTREFFHSHSGKKNGFDSWCKVCRAAQRNPICRGRFRGVISDEDLKKLKDTTKQCKICNAETPLVVDHDHKSGTIRGMLCQHCNRGLGHFRDNPALLLEAARYLERK